MEEIHQKIFIIKEVHSQLHSYNVIMIILLRFCL